MAQIKTNLQYGVTGSLQTGSIAGDAIDGTKIADDAINSEHLAAGGIDTAHIADDQITLAKMAAGTDGNIITYDASGNPAVVAVGTSGHFLKSQGAGSVPVFAAAGGANNVLIATRTPSGASLIHFDDTEITSTYKRYIIDLINLNGASAAQFRCRFVNSGGDMTSDYYRWAMKVHSSNNNNWDTYSGANTEHIALTDLNTESGDAYPLSYRIFLEDPSSTSMYPAMFWTGLAISTDDYVMCINGAGYYYNSTAAIEGIKIYFSSGNIDSGYAKLYGVV